MFSRQTWRESLVYKFYLNLLATTLTECQTPRKDQALPNAVSTLLMTMLGFCPA